jgi:lipopolysaccharide/colanic/teichoic acid biosynthesis glycosyltransferase
MATEEGIMFRAKVVNYPPVPLDNDDDDDNSKDGQEQNSSDVFATLDKVLVGNSDLGFAQIPVSFESVPVGDVFDYVSKPYPKWKRAFDIVAAGSGLAICSPVLLASAIAIRCTSTGPIFFVQPRTGQFGRKFHILKLRTMVKNAEDLKSELWESNERDGPAFKMKSDPRVTTVGKFLRRTGLDELPQLINVLKGEMAIVGPRPLPCNEDADCERWQRRRLDTKPGLTCYWQIAKSRQIRFVEWMRMDLRYGDRRSLAEDVKLVFKTCISVFLGRVGH